MNALAAIKPGVAVERTRDGEFAVAQTYEAAATELEMELRAGSEANGPGWASAEGGNGAPQL